MSVLGCRESLAPLSNPLHAAKLLPECPGDLSSETPRAFKRFSGGLTERPEWPSDLLSETQRAFKWFSGGLLSCLSGPVICQVEPREPSSGSVVAHRGLTICRVKNPRAFKQFSGGLTERHEWPSDLPSDCIGGLVRLGQLNSGYVY